MLPQLLGGFATLFEPLTFLYLVGGFLMGLLFGTIPGLTATLAIALLLPFTFGMEITSALVMVMGIYMAGIYSGSVTGITVIEVKHCTADGILIGGNALTELRL